MDNPKWIEVLPAIPTCDHGLTMLYIDGLATLETAKTIDDMAEKVIATLMYGLVKGEP